ncbi:unnamed protein product [Mytilus coruscus]|uniref:Fucolectin tachylectin-4 pentraxin-1 domain-containing protein n=1 Tax=Mytilus coruscus TaxID=42192 RepID=A0A6J8EBU3_MYTCO|nr:unnamed protein product [Mytilus coruscus]
MCFVKDMNYISVFINAIVVALMAIYVYQNEKRIEEKAAKHNQTGNSIISYLEPKSLALERMESKLNETTAILDRHSGILQDILEAEQRGNITTAILNSHSDMLQEILKAVRKDNDTINLREVAYGKPAQQSSIYSSEHSASRAVDGNVNTYIHTNIEQSPYWIVDLGKTYQIKRIEIFNRVVGDKSTGERLRNLDIIIGPSHNEMHLCAHYVGPAQLGDHLLFKCGHVENARYVKLMLTGTDYLNVAEVKVYAVNDRPT